MVLSVPPQFLSRVDGPDASSGRCPAQSPLSASLSSFSCTVEPSAAVSRLPTGRRGMTSVHLKLNSDRPLLYECEEENFKTFF